MPYRRREDGRVGGIGGGCAATGVVALRRVRSGCVNDYVEWLVAGLAIIGAALALS
jgi:hypothetical protein